MGLQPQTTADSPLFDATDAPDEIVVARGGRDFRMSWTDGSKAETGAEQLRLRCRCAWCTRARADGEFPDAFEDVAIVAIEPFGAHAAHIRFSDGHDRGIFPWTYLRGIATGAAEAAVRPRG